MTLLSSIVEVLNEHASRCSDSFLVTDKSIARRLDIKTQSSLGRYVKQLLKRIPSYEVWDIKENSKMTVLRFRSDTIIGLYNHLESGRSISTFRAVEPELIAP